MSLVTVVPRERLNLRVGQKIAWTDPGGVPRTGEVRAFDDDQILPQWDCGMQKPILWSATGLRVLEPAAGAVKAPKAKKAPAGHFRTILADPPWRFQNWSMEEHAKRGEQWARRNGRSPYDCLDTEAVCALPVQQVAAKDCTLLLWCTWPKLAEGLRVIDAWGFIYKSGFPWVKMTRAAAPRIGLGYHVRSSSEPLLIATRGNPPAPDVARRPVGVIFNPIGEHSAKPDTQYDIAEGYPGPYLELFHRPRGGMFPPRENWTFLGDAVDGQDMRAALESLVAKVEP